MDFSSYTKMKIFYFRYEYYMTSILNEMEKINKSSTYEDKYKVYENIALDLYNLNSINLFKNLTIGSDYMYPESFKEYISSSTFLKKTRLYFTKDFFKIKTNSSLVKPYYVVDSGLSNFRKILTRALFPNKCNKDYQLTIYINVPKEFTEANNYYDYYDAIAVNNMFNDHNKYFGDNIYLLTKDINTIIRRF